MIKAILELINSQGFHTFVFRSSIITWLIFLTIAIYRTDVSLNKTQLDIAQRVGHRYTAEDAAKDGQKQNNRFNSIERRIGILETGVKQKLKH